MPCGIQKLQGNNSTFFEVLVINFFEALRACLGMSAHTKLKRHNQFVTSINPKLFVRNQPTDRLINSLSS